MLKISLNGRGHALGRDASLNRISLPPWTVSYHFYETGHTTCLLFAVIYCNVVRH